jgi:amino acid transporter
MAGLFSSLLLSYSRLPFALARDGYLPAALARLHPARGTPWVAIAASAACCTFLALFPFTELVVFGVTLYSLALGLQCVAVVQRRWRGAPAGAFRIPGGWAGVALAAGCPMVITALNVLALGPRALFWDALAALTGPVAYGMIKTLRGRDAALATTSS